MTLIISISTETESKLKERAAAEGKELSTLAAQILDQAAIDLKRLPGNSGLPAPSTQVDGELPETTEAVQEFDSALDELFSAGERSLPDVAGTFSRDDIYFDHD